MATQTYKSWSVVTASTAAFTICFMVWMMFAVIGISIKKALDLNETQFGVVRASPMWMYFAEVRPLAAEQSRKHPEPVHYT